MLNIFFSDFFKVPGAALEEYGAFDISLINDLPLFIDPFLLFNSEKYKKLHDSIIEYVRFLKKISEEKNINPGLIKSWFFFPEVKQNWLGYSKMGNRGSGLGQKFAEALHKNLHTVFQNFGEEEITKSSHLEKLCLIRDGVGRDNISDFTTNLIKGFLLEYTEEFARLNIKLEFLKKHMINHVAFNYQTRTWISKEYLLPTLNEDYVLLTPKDILTKDETWINREDMIHRFRGILHSLPNYQLRAQIDEYFRRILPINHNAKAYSSAVLTTIYQYPSFIDYYIKEKENSGEEAKASSALKVSEIKNIFVENIRALAKILSEKTPFYDKSCNSHEEAYQRVLYLKHVIEDQDGYRYFYLSKGEPIKRESDLHIAYRLTWYGTKFDVNSEVNNGLGPVDYKISEGSKNKTLVEFKLASNSSLKNNLAKQVEVYEQANQTKNSIKVILFFSDLEYLKVQRIFKELKMVENKCLVLIDARKNNKIPASKRKI